MSRLEGEPVTPHGIRRDTVGDVAEQSYRVGVPTRWLDEEIRPVRELAQVETEGNVSQMIRKLVREALQARSDATPAGPAQPERH